jgi:hypothetical protein
MPRKIKEGDWKWYAAMREAHPDAGFWDRRRWFEVRWHKPLMLFVVRAFDRVFSIGLP